MAEESEEPLDAVPPEELPDDELPDESVVAAVDEPPVDVVPVVLPEVDPPTEPSAEPLVVPEVPPVEVDGGVDGAGGAVVDVSVTTGSDEVSAVVATDPYSKAPMSQSDPRS